MALRAHSGKLRAHQAAVLVAADAARLARRFRGPAAVDRSSQLARAALSIPSNIAEGCGRGTVRDFRLFLGYARGSALEVLSQLTVARLLEPHLTREIRALEARCAAVVKLLRRLYDRPPREV